MSLLLLLVGAGGGVSEPEPEPEPPPGITVHGKRLTLEPKLKIRREDEFWWWE